MSKDILNAATALRPTCKERRTLRGEKKHKKCFKESIKKWSTALGNFCVRDKSRQPQKKILPFPIMQCCFYSSHNFGDIKSDDTLISNQPQQN